MICSALYVSESKIMPGRYYSLSLDKGVKSANHQLRVTKTAVAQIKAAGDFPYEITAGGVRVTNGVNQLPYVYIRTTNGKGPTGAYQVFLTPGELALIGAEFKLPPPVVARSFFASRSCLRGWELEVAPIEFELLDPVWRKDFLNWIVHPAPPDPSGLPWQTANSFLSFPALVPKVSFSKKKDGDVHGRFTFRSIGAEAHAFFHFGNKTRSYRLQPDQIANLGDGQSGRSDFNRAIFETMLGEQPARTEYSCWKKGWGKVVQFADKLLVFSEPAGFSFMVKDELYLFRFVRRERELYLFCHRDSSSPRPLAWACWRLMSDGQLPINPNMTARKPGDGMPEFGVL